MEHFEKLISNGLINKKNNKFDLAIKYFEDAYKIFPNNVDVIYQLGNLERSYGNLTKAKDYFYQAIKIQPKNTKAHRMISTLTDYKDLTIMPS